MAQAESRFINSTQSYGWVSIFIHWLSFIMAALIFGLGLYMVELTYYDTLYNILPEWHKGLGLLLGALTILRLAWFLITSPPAILAASRLQVVLARVAHLCLYLALFGLTLSGYLIVTADGAPVEVFGLSWIPAVTTLNADEAEWVGQIHRWLAYGFAALVLLHATAALYHHLFHHDNTLKRMLFPLSRHYGE